MKFIYLNNAVVIVYGIRCVGCDGFQMNVYASELSFANPRPKQEEIKYFETFMMQRVMMRCCVDGLVTIIEDVLLAS